MNLVLEGRMGVGEAAYVLGLSERHARRILEIQPITPVCQNSFFD